LFELIRSGLAAAKPGIRGVEPEYTPFREGDVRHSQADTSKIRKLLGYEPTHDIKAGLEEALAWYTAHLG